MRSTAIGMPETLYLGIPLPLWNLLWVGTLHNTDYYRAAFLSLYGLRIGTMVVDGSDIEAVVIRDGFLAWWVSATLFVLSPEGACLDGCPLSSLPWQST